MHFKLGMPHFFQRFQRRVEDFRKFFGNYLYYRKRNHSHTVAWGKAKNTM